jgi:hypothetical protein
MLNIGTWAAARLVGPQISCVDQNAATDKKAGERLALVAAENENNQERTHHQASHQYPGNGPAP